MVSGGFFGFTRLSAQCLLHGPGGGNEYILPSQSSWAFRGHSFAMLCQEDKATVHLLVGVDLPLRLIWTLKLVLLWVKLFRLWEGLWPSQAVFLEACQQA